MQVFKKYIIKAKPLATDKKINYKFSFSNKIFFSILILININSLFISNVF